MECLGDLRDGLFGVFELVDEGADKRGADVLVGGFLRRAFDDPVQILRRHAQLRSVPPDGVLMADASQEQPYKLLEQHVFATDARQLAVFVFLPDVLVGNVHHEHPEGALQHFGTETMRIVIKNLHNALDSFLKKAVIVPLEEEINGVENMTYMTSSATNTGSGSITVYFKQGTEPDMAAINVQNRVTKAQGTLPGEVTKIGVTAQKRQNSQLQLMSLYCTNGDYDEKFLTNYLKINVVLRIQRISGVGEVMVMGNDYAMRIWLRPDAMAQHGLVPADIVAVLGEQNIEASTGTLGEDSENTFQYTLKYRGRYETGEEFENLVVRTDENGNVLRLGEVADIELGTTSYSFSGGVSGYPSSTFMVMQTAGSNANEIIEKINSVADEIRDELPEGLVLEQMMSVKTFLDASTHNVIKTLIEAVLLVIIVVYVFLQSIRSTFIPLVGIFVSLVGTFAFLYVAGFSINLLTLFALVLVIGTASTTR